MNADCEFASMELKGEFISLLVRVIGRLIFYELERPCKKIFDKSFGKFNVVTVLLQITV